jgi:hypothetical protein
VEVWSFSDDNIVDKRIVDREVPMDEPVTHSDDATPRDSGMAESHIIRQSLDSFPDDLEASSEGELQDLVRKEAIER